MIPKERITYYTSVTFMNGAWQAYCYLESYCPSVYDSETDHVKSFQYSSTNTAADALRLIANEIEAWEKENIND